MFSAPQSRADRHELEGETEMETMYLDTNTALDLLAVTEWELEQATGRKAVRLAVERDELRELVAA